MVTDHNLVIMNLKLKLSKLNKPKTNPIPKIDIEKLQDPKYVWKYQEEIEESEIMHKDDCGYVG